MQIIKKRRCELEMTQVELAQRIGVTQGAVTQWENRITNPSAAMLPKIAKVLECTVDELLKQESE